jgi:hypothetical protein
MRVSDDRYSRDLRRLQLAWRMILLGARTPTVAHWTALSVYRIRRLRHHYAPDTAQHAALKGITPFRVDFFSKSATLRCEAPMLAGFLRHFDVLPDRENFPVNELANLKRGENFCSAYAQFRMCCPQSEITFEHAVMLLTQLVHGVEIRLELCVSCRGLVVWDCLSNRQPRCGYCLHDAHAGLSHFKARAAASSTPAEEPTSADGPQQRLF